MKSIEFKFSQRFKFKIRKSNNRTQEKKTRKKRKYLKEQEIKLKP